jgi:CheY-like chemotaxis protein
MGATILVVDDKANVRELIRDYLDGQGFHVVTAANGREALYAARQENPDAILLDIMMPEMDGYQFLKLYRRERSVPVIIVTARDEESDAVMGLELGADDYVIKPFRPGGESDAHGIQPVGNPDAGPRAGLHARAARGSACRGWLFRPGTDPQRSHPQSAGKDRT